MIPFEIVVQMAQAIADSGLFGVKTSKQALGLMLVAQAEGRHPAEAARDYHIIDGRPSLKADTMLARFQEAGGTVKWDVYTDEEVCATFTHAQGGSLKLSWTMAMAKDAGLAGKENWKKYPRAMLRARVISEGIRTVYPAVLVGMYTPEEIQDLRDNTRQEPTQTVEASVVPEPKITPKPFDKVKAVSRIFAVLPKDDVDVRTLVEEYGIILPECAPSEFRAVLDECLVDQIKDRDHAGEIYTALRDSLPDELDLEMDMAAAADGQPD